MLLSMLCLPYAQTAYPFIVKTTASDMRLGSIWRQKKCDSERAECAKGHGGYGKRKFFVKHILYLVSMGVKWEWGIYVKEKICVAIARRIRGILHYFICR